MSLQSNAQKFTEYVNPFIGTGGHGHTYPGATVPFGFVQLSPDTRPDGYNDWDGCGGYHYSDSIIYGFSHTHLSGTGVADYCDILLMPTVGEASLTNIKDNNPKLGYASKFSHVNEKASPGFYSVLLEDDSIPVELTATARVGMHKYLFPKSNQANIILDLTHRDKLLEGCYIEIISSTKIQGLRRSSSWAKDQWLYFAIEFSQPFYNSEIISGDIIAKNQVPSIVSGTELKSYFQFKTDGKTPVYVKCALSPVSCAGAWNNMKSEIPDWDFEKVKQNANDTWNKELSKIEITSLEDEKKSLSDSTNKLVIFYTALYHCMLAPNIYEDVDGRYRGRDNKIHTAEGFDYYTVFSLWDTFRAEHPLFTIIDQKRTADFINTFLKQYEQGGRLPVWELSSNETDCMIGYHAVSVIADAAVKGIKGFDYNEAYEAMKHSANLDIYGLKYYKEKGFIESNEEPESVSKTLEYSYDDWCIYKMGTLLKSYSDAEKYFSRGFNFLNLKDGYFARPRFNGGWYSPFDPYEVNFNYTEANAWQYSAFHPQSSEYISEIFLDSLFNASDKTSGREQSDITGLIGQYAHGNEPSHQIPYLYNYTTAPWKTALYVNKIINQFYKNTPDGLIGNEDCGQMSAWYVLSSIGFYQVCPGSPQFTYGTTAFDNVIIHLENKNEFTIKSLNNNVENIYLKSIRVNDIPETDFQINYDQMIQGAELAFIKTNKKDEAFIPKLNTNGDPGYPMTVPIIYASSSTFKDSMQVIIKQAGGGLIMTTDGSDPLLNPTIPIARDTSFYIYENKIIQAINCYKNSNLVNGKLEGCSGIVTAHFYKLPHNYSLSYLTKYNSQYPAGGDAALIDGLHGGDDFRTGMWQGWQGENMEVVLDLGKQTEIKKAGAGFLQDVRSWIWMPVKMDIYTSDDGQHFNLLTTINNTIANNNYESKEIQNLTTEFPSVKTRYVKFVATQFGTIPESHPGKGGASWVFCDEVWVE